MGVSLCGRPQPMAGPTDSVLRVLHVVGGDDIIECHPTLHEALAS
ncbi:hypothetical protein [Streptomyces prasinus]